MIRPCYVPSQFPGRCKIFPPSESLLLKYQQDWVEDDSIMKLMEKSRRIGISFSTAYERVRKHSRDDWNLDSWVSSRDEPTSRLVIRDCKAFAKILHVGAKDLGSQVLDEKGGSGHVLSFANRTHINSVASNADVFAGKGGDVLLDEFALRPQPRDVFAIAGPTIDWGGTLAIVSTHRGSANFFNELIREIRENGNPKGFSHHKVTLENALDQGLLYKLQSKFRPGDRRLDMDEADYFSYQRSRAADEESFMQEYCCIPGDDNAAFLSYDIIASCEYREGEAWETSLVANANPFYVGVDVGRTRDLTVIWVIEKVSDAKFTRRVIELDRRSFDEQEAVLYAILALPNMRRCCIDHTGIGRQFAERAIQRFGQYRVEGLHFSGPVKEELAYPVRAAFEDRSIRIPHDPKIRADLRGIKKETTASGNIRFVGERDSNGHCDRFWALALALHAGKTVTASMTGDSVAVRPGERAGRNMSRGLGGML